MSDAPNVTARTPDPDVTTRRGDSLPPVDLVQPAGGRYVLGPELARGGMGAVFRATDTALGREVAVKLLQEQFGPASGTARRFADEARIAGQLQHPGIPPVHDFGTLPDGRPFLAMKLIKGDTLDDLLRARRDPGDDRGRFVAAFEAVCQAVGYAHSRDVIHRDLKPANVMVGAFGEVQVMDWGLAKVLRPGGAADGTVADTGATAPNTEVRSLRDSDADHTQAGAVMGTPAYMPPEQAAGAAHKVTPRSDVFGLGAVLAVILTGRPPFEAGSAETVRVKAAQGDVADCLARLDDCGAEPELVALCKRCLSPRPADRPATAGEVAAAVADFRAQAEARARQAELDRVKADGERATAEATAAEGRKRRRVQLWLAAAAVLLVAGAGGVAVWRVVEDGNKRFEAARLEGEERDRNSRAADAVAALLDPAGEALAAGDAARAAPLLDQAARRAADGGAADHAGRLAGHARDLAVLRELDEIDDYRWTVQDARKLPLDELVVERWAAAFARYGIVPGTTPPAEAAARVNGSSIRSSLLGALDGWLALSRSAPVHALLTAADANPFRDEVRRLLAARDTAGLDGLANRTEWAAQPTGLALGYGASPHVRRADARALLTRLAVPRRSDFRLLMQLGASYPINTPDAAAERAQWHRAAAALRPGNVSALNNLGIALDSAGDPAGAVAVYREVIRLKAGYALAHNNLGIALVNLRDLDGGVAAYREAIRLDPGFPLPHHNLGNALRAKRDFAGAAAAHREAVRLDPELTVAHYGLGLALREKGDLDGAVAAHREAVRLDPKYADAYSDLGMALRDKGDLDGAVTAYREAIRLVPGHVKAHGNLGIALVSKNDEAGAEAAFREAIRLDPKVAGPHIGLGFTLARKGNPDGAVSAFREAIRLDPTNFFTHNNLGLALRAKGDLAGAAAALREGIRLNPKLVGAHNELGFTLVDAEDWDGAAAAYREAVRLDPKNPDAHNGLGRARAGKGDRAGAAAAYREAIRVEPRYGAPHNNLGLILEAESDLAGAEAEYRESVRLDPRYAPAHASLGDVLRKQGRHADAVAAYRGALAVAPDLDAARDGLAYCERVLRGEVPTAPPPRAVAR